MSHYTLLYAAIICMSFGACQSHQATPAQPGELAIALTRSEMRRNPQAWMLDFRQTPKWGYVQGLVCQAILEVWKTTGDSSLFAYAKSYPDTFIDSAGVIQGYEKESYNLDHLNSGKMLFTLYDATGDARYLTAIGQLIEQVRDQPRTPEGGFWHKQIYPNQMWLDGLYMSAPFYAEYAARFADTAAFADIAHQFLLLRQHAYDSASGLYYHGWDASRSVFWAHPETGLSANFWGRSIGWLYMALVDVLDHFPIAHPDRTRLIDLFQELTQGILRHQDSSGLWYQVPNFPDQEGNYLEATSSAMFAYGLLKGVQKGYLGAEAMKPARQAFDGLINHLVKIHPDGEVELTQCCAVAGLGPAKDLRRDGSFAYYISEPIRSNDGKGTGPLIMAALLLQQLDQ